MLFIFYFIEKKTVDDTKCTQEQIEYDKAIANGSIGRFMQRAECDENGDYLNIKCIPGQL